MALDDHNHDTGKGLGVFGIQTGTAPSATGHIRINGDVLQFWAGSAAAIYSAMTLAGTQTVTGTKNILLLQTGADAGRKFQKMDGASTAVSTAQLNVYGDPEASVSWPATFGSTPYVMVSAANSEAAYSWAGSIVTATSTTAVRYGACSAVNTNNVTITHWGIG